MLTTAIALLVGVPIAEPAPTDVKAVWERMKGMAGDWAGEASDGRKIYNTYELIAGNSVLMKRSWFEGHPGEQMVTMHHLDNNRIILTHYCVARNQPRLVASEISTDRNKVTFTFLDGTGMKDRNTGHMDKCLQEWVDDDHIKSRWTWYQNGKESWMEEFALKRVKK
jgi:hypothetical protein